MLKNMSNMFLCFTMCQPCFILVGYSSISKLTSILRSLQMLELESWKHLFDNIWQSSNAKFTNSTVSRKYHMGIIFLNIYICSRDFFWHNFLKIEIYSRAQYSIFKGPITRKTRGDLIGVKVWAEKLCFLNLQ